MLRAVVLAFVFVAVSTCTAPAELEEALGPEAPGSTYPELIPQAEIVATGDRDIEAEAEEAEAFEERVKALKARAANVKKLDP